MEPPRKPRARFVEPGDVSENSGNGRDKGKRRRAVSRTDDSDEEMLRREEPSEEEDEETELATPQVRI